MKGQREYIPCHPSQTCSWPPSPSMTSAVKKMQEKLFRRGESTPSPEPQQQQQSDRAEPGLTINIPNKVPFPTTQAQPPPKLKPADSAPKASAEVPQSKSYRQRLAEALGAAYKGAEKHRLQQDDAREKHWKRWGPYLSDRQWVRTRYHSSVSIVRGAACLSDVRCLAGYGPRGLFGKRRCLEPFPSRAREITRI